MHRLIPALVVMVGCQTAPPVKQPQDILPCVWMIATPFGAGSATVIDCRPDGDEFVVTALTAKHVLRHHMAPGYEIHLVQPGQRHRGGTVKALHPALDVALLEFRLPAPLAVADVSYANLEAFRPIWGVGYAAMSRWVSRGVVSAPNRGTILAAPGDSGGAVVDDQGRLVGVISHVNVLRRTGQQISHHCTFVPLAGLEEWISRHR